MDPGARSSRFEYCCCAADIPLRFCCIAGLMDGAGFMDGTGRAEAICTLAMDGALCWLCGAQVIGRPVVALI